MRTTTSRLAAAAAAGLVIVLAGLTAPASALSADGAAGVGLRRDRRPRRRRRPRWQATGRTTATSRRPSRRPSPRTPRSGSAKKPGGAVTGASVPVYVHVMAAANGEGNVTDAQIAQQIAVLNTTFAGQEGGSNTGFTFTLAGSTATSTTAGTQDKQSNSYRAADPAGRRQRR